MSECDHIYDGGYCLECGDKMMCVLCDVNPWETMCDICERGRICGKCYTCCPDCGQKYCYICGECEI